MKKALLLIAAAMTAGSMMANVDMYIGGKADPGQDISGGELLTPGSSYVWNEAEFEDWGSYGGQYKYDPAMYLMSDASTTVTVVAKCTTGQDIGLCCGGACENKPMVTKENVPMTANKPLLLQFDYMQNVSSPDEKPDQDVTTEISVTANGGSAQVYTIIFNHDDGVRAIERDRTAYATSRSIVYSVSGNSMVNVYDMNGRQVLGARVNGSGVIDLSSLAKGIYTYRINGAANNSGKVLVR